MLVAQLMSSAPIGIVPDGTLKEAMRLMNEHPIRHLVVAEAGRLQGLISERDLLEAVGWDPERAFDGAESRQKVARDYMSVPVETIASSDDVSTAAARMLKHRIGCLPVEDEGKLVGILTEWDIVHSYAESFRGSSPPPHENPLIHDVMITKPLTVEDDISVTEALDICGRQRVRHLPITHEGWFVGLISDRDLRLSKGRKAQADLAVGKVMRTDMITTTPGKTLSEAAALLTEHKFGALPVVEAGPKLLGLVTTSDILQAFRA